MSTLKSFKNKLIATTALAVTLVGGYGRRAYAIPCGTVSPPSYLCSGTYTSSIILNGISNPSVSTASDFYMHVPDSDGIEITGNAAVSFTDTYASDIIVRDKALTVYSTGDYGGIDGSVNININSNIVSYNAEGLLIRNFGNGETSITSDGNVSAGTLGIDARSIGTGALSVTSNGQVIGGEAGIYARNSYGTELIITTGENSYIAGINGFGIYADHTGSGVLSITVDGEVIGGRFGVAARNFGTDLTINTGIDSVINGISEVGINAFHYGSDVLSITAEGKVLGQYSGIRASNYGTDLIITTGSNSVITGIEQYGIRAENEGTGILSITADGDVTGGKFGIYASNSSSGTDTIISVGASSVIKGESYIGVDVRHSGSGSASLTIDGEVTGYIVGVNALVNYGTGLTINAGTSSVIVSENKHGIVSINNGTGFTSIVADGYVKGAGLGIYAAGSEYTTDLIISTGADSYITGTNSSGIQVHHKGTGVLSITAGGTVTGGNAGISATTYGYDLVINTDSNANVVGMNYSGIHAVNNGTGNILMEIDGDVTGHGYHGISLYNNVTAQNIIIKTGVDSHVTAGMRYGIYSRSQGTGYTSADIAGSVTGAYGGVVLFNESTAQTGMTVSTDLGSEITALSGFGIYLVHSGTGDISVEVNGDVTAVDGGIRARNSNVSDNLIIRTGIDSVITSDYSAIYAFSNGVGALTIAVDGQVTGGDRGIYGSNSLFGTNLTITTGADSYITGTAGNGIEARHFGSGVLSITSDGTVIGSAGGIDARNYGSSYLSMTINGDVSGTSGIIAINYPGSDLLIYTGADSVITGTNYAGIRALNYGSGVLSVSVDGQVTGNNNGIFSYNINGSNLMIQAGADSVISGGVWSYGIVAVNKGTGSLSVSADGNISGGNGGIYARNYGTDLTITSSADSALVGAYAYGIWATNFGTGSLSVNVNSIVSGGHQGIWLDSLLDSGLDLTIGADAVVTGTSRYGVQARNYGTGPFSITNHGHVIGNIGIRLTNNGSSSNGLFTNGVIEGTGGVAIDFAGYGGTNSSTTATPVEIAGGRIIGDVVDNYYSEGFSPVTVSGDFTSEGNFRVSDFNVSAAGDFTLGAGNRIESYNGISVDGKFTVGGTGASSGASAFAVNSTGSLYVNEDFAMEGQFSNGGKTHIATGKQLSVDTMAPGAPGDLYFGFNTSADHALLTVINGAADLTNQTLHIDVTGVTGLATNEQALLINGAGAIIGGPGGTAVAVDDNSVLWDFRIVDGTGSVTPTTANDLFLIAAQSAPISQLANTANNAAVGDVLMTLQSTPNPELAAIVGNMNSASTNEAFNDVLEASQPGADMAEAATMMGFTNFMMDAVGDRLDILRQGAEPASDSSSLAQTVDVLPRASGLEAWALSFGNEDPANGFNSREWQGAFGRYSRQDAKDGIDGYEGTVAGLTVGIDTGQTYDDLVLGAAFSYAQSDIKSFNANRSRTKIDGFQAMLYGTKKFKKDIFLDVMASYAQNQNDTKRYNVGGVPGLTAAGDFVSRETGLALSAGRSFDWRGFNLTPSFSADWLHYTADGYTETGAGGASLSVETRSLDSFRIGPDMKFAKTFKREDGTIIIPEIHIGYKYDVIGDALQKTSQFTGGGAAFTTESPNPERHSVNVGAGISYSPANNWDYSLTYNLDAAKGFQSHALMAKAAWKF